MVGFKCHLSDLECCVRAGFRFRNFFGVLFNSHKFETELANCKCSSKWPVFTKFHAYNDRKKKSKVEYLFLQVLESRMY